MWLSGDILIYLVIIFNLEIGHILIYVLLIKLFLLILAFRHIFYNHLLLKYLH